MRIATIVVTVLLCGLASENAHAQSGDSRAGIVDSIVRAHMGASRIPGMGVIVADRSATLLAKGYGVRQLGVDAAVDEHTQFLIASFSKTFTATTLGLLVAEGRLRWSDPVRQHLTWFTTDDAYATERATVRDLAAIRVGWPSGDSLVFGLQDTDALTAHVRARPVGAFRATQGQAGNLSYALLGRTIEVLVGESWYNAVRQRILVPLGMGETYASYASARATGNWAEGHAVTTGAVTTIPTTELPLPLAAAGGLTSSAADLGPWIQFQLGGRDIGAAQGVVDSVLRNIQRPQVLLGSLYQATFRAPSSVVGYGHGWVVYEDRGHRVLEHAGAWQGYTSFIALLPDDNVGFALLTNLRQGAALEELRRLRTALIRALAPHSASK